ncbi:unnamed protein product [Clonostachys rosea]|uniref:HNH nuclease domain-containing protein n=1 Tax=Bionectria ochroleuca TaxID=29856 RepID=A0ABY6V3I7_BIOOC|nr:unnamed protein product [Clonostachys rosea]
MTAPFGCMCGPTSQFLAFVTNDTHCSQKNWAEKEINSMAASHSEQHEDVVSGFPETDKDSDVESFSGEEMTEEEIQMWYSASYKRGSKKPMQRPLTAAWGLALSDIDFERLKGGFKSKSMDDKWDILVEDPNEKGGTSIHIIRNWLHEECYILHIVPKSSTDGGGRAVIQEITWEGDLNGLQCDAEQAEKEAVLLCRMWLKCDFETRPHYDRSVMWDRKAYRKLDVA